MLSTSIILTIGFPVFSLEEKKTVSKAENTDLEESSDSEEVDTAEDNKKVTLKAKKKSLKRPVKNITNDDELPWDIDSLFPKKLRENEKVD